jgi:hypothetical protein
VCVCDVLNSCQLYRLKDKGVPSFREKERNREEGGKETYERDKGRKGMKIQTRKNFPVERKNYFPLVNL